MNLDFAVNLPKASVGVITHGKKVLLVSRKNQDVGKCTEYGLPGGKLELNESYLESCLREITEETGVIIDSKNCFELCAGVDDVKYYVKTFYLGEFQPKIHKINSPENLNCIFGNCMQVMSGPFKEYNSSVMLLLQKYLISNIVLGRDYVGITKADYLCKMLKNADTLKNELDGFSEIFYGLLSLNDLFIAINFKILKFDKESNIADIDLSLEFLSKKRSFVLKNFNLYKFSYFLDKNLPIS